MMSTIFGAHLRVHWWLLYFALGAQATVGWLHQQTQLGTLLVLLTIVNSKVEWNEGQMSHPSLERMKR